MGALDKILLAVFVLPPILLSLSFFGPWYNYSLEGGSGMWTAKISEDFYFDRCYIEANVPVGFSYMLGSGRFNLEIDYSHELFDDKNDFIDTIDFTRTLVIIGLIFSIIGLIWMILFVTKNMFIFAFIFSILAMTFALLPALYFMNVFPAAITEDGLIEHPDQEHSFFGSDEMSGIKQSWGGAWGWASALAAGIISLIGFIIFVMP